jgi:uncharacterized protein (TIGR02246 family)
MDRSSDTAAIHQLFDAITAAWHRGDTDALRELYTPDSDYVTFDGSWIQGVEENRRLHAQLFDGLLSGTRLEGKIESLRFVTDDVAVAIGTGALVWPWHREIPANRLSRQTMVMVKRDGRWRVASFQNTRVRPLPRLDSPMAKLFAAVIRWRVARWNKRHGLA